MSVNLASFIQTVTPADRSNIVGTLAQVQDNNGFTKTEVRASKNFEGSFYVVLSDGADKRLSLTFSKELSKAYAAGEITNGMLLNCEVAGQKNAAGEERLKLQQPAGSRPAIDITGVKAETFKRAASLADVIKAAGAKSVVA